MKQTKWLFLLLAVSAAALVLVVRSWKHDVTPKIPAASTPVETPAQPKPATVAPNASTGLSEPVGKGGIKNVDGQEQAPRGFGNYLKVIVQNGSGQPVEGASVQMSFRGEQRRPVLRNLARTYATSPSGVADAFWPTEGFVELVLVISKESFASRSMTWDLKGGDRIPFEFTVKLASGIQIGGYVVDMEGNPVANATVTLSRFWRGGEEIRRQGEEATFPTQKHVTGDDGLWTVRDLPHELLERISIAGDHPDFISARVSIAGNSPMERELRAGTYRLQLRRGLEARGRVLNEQGQPIEGARVRVGRKFSQDGQETTTDGEGRFSFRNVNQGMIDFSASAEGYAPDTKSHNVNTETEEIVFRLARGSTIAGKVQDESGQPIPGVRVSVERQPGELSNLYEFSTTTDDHGLFEWRSAPNGPMPFSFGKVGYMRKPYLKLKPGEENIVTLLFAQQIQGLVVNAETGDPVTRFKITISADRSKDFWSEEGLFTMDLDVGGPNEIRATATGYDDQTQALPPAEAGQIKVKFRMKPSVTLTGIVITPGGQPVPGAQVALVDEIPGGRSIQFAHGRISSYNTRSILVTTDASGRFSFTSTPESGLVVSANGSGYGSATLAELKSTGLLTLQPFGRIEGVFMQGSSPGAGQELVLNSPTSGIHFEFQSTKQTTDAVGHFAFENVPAGIFSIERLAKAFAGWMHTHRTAVVIVPGQTTQVVLGGTDATLQGRARFDSAVDVDYMITVRLDTFLPPPPAGLTPEELTAFINSKERKELIMSTKHYGVVVGKDGAFALDSVAPGQYTLEVTATKKDEAARGMTRPWAEGRTTVTVPPGVDPATPITIGEVVLKALK